VKPVSTEIGPNRTGIGTSPIDSKEMLEAVDLGPVSPGGPELAEALRREYAESDATIGTVPPPTTVKGVITTVSQSIRGQTPVVYLDKLGERLAFERTGTRLYELIRVKVEASATWKGGPTLADVQRIHDEELEHFHLLREVLEELGADPTATTPSADVIGVASSGLLQVISDARTTLPQSLDALLTAELTDNDGWQMLIDLGTALGKKEHVARFERARAAEAVHLADVRRWLSVEAALETKRDLVA